MSNIKIFGLGGLGEIGKNLYVVEVDKLIFVLEAGIKNPPLEMFGVDAIIPDISYLKENKARIQGIFLSHGRDDKIGAIPLILKDLNTNVYSSSFTIEILKDSLDEEEIKLFTSCLDMGIADRMIENVLGTFEIPLGIAVNFKVNGKEYLVPMATEESSVVAAASNGKLKEAFGTGTAAVISPVGQITYKDKDYVIAGGKMGELSQKLYDEIVAIQYAEKPDPYGWVEKIG